MTAGRPRGLFEDGFRRHHRRLLPLRRMRRFHGVRQRGRAAGTRADRRGGKADRRGSHTGFSGRSAGLSQAHGGRLDRLARGRAGEGEMMKNTVQTEGRASDRMRTLRPRFPGRPLSPASLNPREESRTGRVPPSPDRGCLLLRPEAADFAGHFRHGQVRWKKFKFAPVAAGRARVFPCPEGQRFRKILPYPGGGRNRKADGPAGFEPFSGLVRRQAGKAVHDPRIFLVSGFQAAAARFPVRPLLLRHRGFLRGAIDRGFARRTGPDGVPGLPQHRLRQEEQPRRPRHRLQKGKTTHEAGDGRHPGRPVRLGV